LICSLPVHSAFGLPVYVAASPAAPFSTPLRVARNDKLLLQIRKQRWLRLLIRQRLGPLFASFHDKLVQSRIDG
jgi:hypothetical protein